MVWESVDHVYPDARESYKSLLICIMFGSVVAANIIVPRDSCNAGMLHEQLALQHVSLLYLYSEPTSDGMTI